MTNFNTPTKLAKITSLISKAYDIEMVYLRPKDIMMEENKVKGQVYINNSWEEKILDIPPFIDVVPYCFKKENREIMNYLKDKTFLSDDRSNVLSKIQLQDILKNDQKFSQLIIPTHNVTKSDDLIHYLNAYSSIVLKPLNGIRGRGVYILNKNNDHYTVGFKTIERQMDENQIATFFEDEIKGKSYILQKYIQSRTVYGDPFDCRVHVEKGEDGKWHSAKNYIRIGIGQKVISNVNQGGGVSDPKPFLKANFGEKWTEINKNLKKIALTLPYKIEELRGTHIMSLGMDIGIDKDGQLYLFEVNDGPATAALISEVAYLRSNYYSYILKGLQRTSTKKELYEK
ncbi:YheC/YheD family protein [Oceanobacillus polygoni]|uniref:Glutathione synthase/RimK-type ligase-like ATP-grasp enzyme n=1 Tax=Oceanobacillus polygoni TaxID=1235259 RepID=A0A9X0YRS1_9BACI|nr:YheC/YheD family protein [Oceanobacillus polygoni]MBP2076160.1 glutathione synthase/RimK-type ligase-like ATP-grasp enzyme [Oceanobacillus polygoni]